MVENKAGEMMWCYFCKGDEAQMLIGTDGIQLAICGECFSKRKKKTVGETVRSVLEEVFGSAPFGYM